MKHSFSKKIYILLLLVIFLFAYISGFVSGAKKIFPYEFAKRYYHIYFDRIEHDAGILKKCTIPNLTILPDKFSVIIGHAYGTHTNSHPDDFIASSIQEFIIKNSSNIEKAIFTGDVFSVPSMRKWERLFQQFGSIDIHIAPGNHDVGRPDSRDVFKASKFIKQNYPYQVKISGLNVILDDSVFSMWKMGRKIAHQIAESKSQGIIIARHHVLITDLLKYANSSSSPIPLPSIEKFIKNFPHQKSVTWIMGDGGAFERLPRITCHFFKNHRFIVNGIGEVKNDTLLILHGGNIFSHIIR